MKIAKRQLRRIIREAIDNAGNEIPDPTKRQSWKDRMNSMGYTDGLEGKMPVSMSSLEDPNYMAGKKDGERDRMNDPHADRSFIEREEVYEGTSLNDMPSAWKQILKGTLK